MRLTLRTLLAYMDDILDPADQEELGKKIEASPFATELIHRSRDAVRRLRLSAPEVLAGDSDDLHEGDDSLDANMAAEYLDNTLPPEEVAEFERACLEAGPHADMLLAEAASCHHILTLVLGEPAEVDGDLRQRMYGLAAQSAAAETPAVAANAAPDSPPVQAAAPVAGVMRRPAVDPDEAAVPDYMLEAARARRRKRNQVIGLMVGAAVLGGAAAFVLWPTRPAKLPETVANKGALEEAISGVDVGEVEPSEAGNAATADAGATAPADSGTADTEAPAFTPTPPVGADEASDETGAGDASTGEVEMPALETPELDLELPAAGDASGDVGIPSTTNIPPVIPGGVDDATDELVLESAAAGTTVDGADVLVPPGETAEPPAPPVDGANMASSESTLPPVPGDEQLADAGASIPPTDPPTAPPPVQDALPGDAAASDAGTVPPAAPTATAPIDDAPRQLATYLGVTNDMLLAFDESAGSWVRVPPRSTFTAGARLMAPPAFRTLVVVGADVNTFIGGGTEATLLPGEEFGAEVALAIPYGHVIINAGTSGNRIALVMGDVTRVVELAKSSSLAIDVRRTFVPGNNPEQQPAPMEISWYLTSGSASWTGAPGETVADESPTAQAPASWVTVGGQSAAPQATNDIPEWVNKETVSSTEASARDDIAETFVAGQPISIPLLELTGGTGLGRRTEVRALAARTAAYVGEFEPLVKSLADPIERAKRKQQVTALRAAVARDPAAVAQIREAFALQRGERAAGDLVEMLLGYNPDMVGTTRQEVQGGDLMRLLGWLDHDDLTYRVLAAHNVNEITRTMGLGGYRPEHTAEQRRRELKFYWDRFESGELMPTAWTPTGWAER